MSSIWETEDFAEQRAYWKRRNRGGRKWPCPTCKQPNRITDHEKRQGYQCDECADKAEAGVPGY